MLHDSFFNVKVLWEFFLKSSTLILPPLPSKVKWSTPNNKRYVYYENLGADWHLIFFGEGRVNHDPRAFPLPAAWAWDKAGWEGGGGGRFEKKFLQSLMLVNEKKKSCTNRFFHPPPPPSKVTELEGTLKNTQKALG